MLSIAFWVLIGAFIGWNIPQPVFAKKIQEKLLSPVVNWVKNKFKMN